MKAFKFIAFVTFFAVVLNILKVCKYFAYERIVEIQCFLLRFGLDEHNLAHTGVGIDSHRTEGFHTKMVQHIK